MQLLILLIFYSPFFWYFGKPLLHYDPKEAYRNYENIVVFSGHGDTSYYNQTYQYRYKDILNTYYSLKNVENIFIFGRLQEIPEQRIIQKLLIADGIPKSKLKIVYEEYDNTHKNINNISEILAREKINKIIFITSPYHTKRTKLLWAQYTNIEVKIIKSFNWPTHNNFFEYAKNKKIIIYEYLSIFYNKIIGNIK